jgi:FkbM family methyltransferase
LNIFKILEVKLQKMSNLVKNIRNSVLYKIGTYLAKLDRRFLILYGYIDTLYKYPQLISGPKLNSIDRDDLISLINVMRFDANLQAIMKVIQLLYDDYSRRIYKAELAYQLLCCRQLFSPYTIQEYNNAEKKLRGLIDNTLDMQLFCNKENINNAPDSALMVSLVTTYIIEQYNYKPHVIVEDSDIFLDCGAFHGETAVWAVRNGAQKVYSFEPNKENFAQLQRTAKVVGEDKIIPLHYGVGEKDSAATVIGTGANAHISSHAGQEAVTIISLDTFCINNNIIPTFIKMDVEGYELKALHGASEILRKYKPKLAICLYHKLSHMWEIPMYIDGLQLGYSFFCKKNHPVWEFVLYCTADKNLT